jgi:hypothetical protein
MKEGCDLGACEQRLMLLCIQRDLTDDVRTLLVQTSECFTSKKEEGAFCDSIHDHSNRSYYNNKTSKLIPKNCYDRSLMRNKILLSPSKGKEVVNEQKLERRKGR